MLLLNEEEANPSRIISLVALFVREIEYAIVVIGKGNRLALSMVCGSLLMKYKNDVIYYRKGADMFSMVHIDSDTYISPRDLLMQYTFRET